MEHLIAYIMNEANVDYEAATDCAYALMDGLDERIRSYFDRYYSMED